MAQPTSRSVKEKHRAMAAGLRAVVAAADQLIACPDLDSLFYRAVVLARETLGLERCGILIRDENGVRGTFGTDKQGRIVDERSLCISNQQRWTDRIRLQRPEGPRWTVDRDVNHYSFDGDKMEGIGRGWVVMTPIQLSGESIGVLCNDSAISHAPLDEVKQEVVAVFCSLLGDIIKRKRAEEALRGTEERYKSLVEAAKDVIFTLSPDGRITTLNPAFDGATGWNRTDWIGQSVFDLIHPDDRGSALQNFQGALRGQAPAVFELRVFSKSNGYLFVEFTASPQIETGKVIGVLGIARDVTGRKRLEKQLLEISDREQRRIGQDLHDGLCQHLAATAFAAGLAEQTLLSKALPEATTVSKVVLLINRATAEARTLAKSLYPLELETRGLSTALRQLALGTQELYDIECHLACEEDIPARDVAMASHLYRIAQEAINNALKHAAPRHIFIGLQRAGDKASLTIADDGRGFVAPSHDTGMGLHIMTYRAGMIGALLEVKSRPAGGTIVSCTFEPGQPQTAGRPRPRKRAKA